MADKDKSIWREILRGSVVDFFKRPLVWVYTFVVLLVGGGIWAAYRYLNAIAIHTTAFGRWLYRRCASCWAVFLYSESCGGSDAGPTTNWNPMSETLSMDSS